MKSRTLFSLALLLGGLPTLAYAANSPRAPRGPNADDARTEAAIRAMEDCNRGMIIARTPQARKALSAQCKTKRQAVKTALTQDQAERRQQRQERRQASGKNAGSNSGKNSGNNSGKKSGWFR